MDESGERNEGLRSREPVGLKEYFYPFDAEWTVWTQPPASNELSRNGQDLKEYMQRARKELDSPSRWGARSSISLDLSSTPSGQELLQRFQLTGIPYLVFRPTAFAILGNPPLRMTTLTPFDPEAGYIPNPQTVDKDTSIPKYIYGNDPISQAEMVAHSAQSSQPVDTTKAPLLLEVGYVPSPRLFQMGLHTGNIHHFSTVPELKELLEGLRFETVCDTKQGRKTYNSNLKPQANGSFSYTTFMPDRGPKPTLFSGGFFVGLPGKPQILDRKISSRFFWSR